MMSLVATFASHDQSSVTYSNSNHLQMRRLQQQQVTLTGEVYYDDNENGQRDDNETGVQMNFIQIRNCDDTYAGRTSSDASGKFTFTTTPGSYYPRFDFTRFTFPKGGAVDPATGKTECVTLDNGEEYSWSIAVVPEIEPTSSPAATPSVAPSTPLIPSVSPTVSFAPSVCLEKRNFTNNIMSSSPVSISTYGMVFSVSSPETNKFLIDYPVDAEYLYIASLTLRVVEPLTLLTSPTKYQVWFKNGDYNQQSDWWGNFDGWTVISEGIASGNGTVGQEPMIQDTVFSSGVNSSDSDLYDVLSLPLDDGGLNTFNSFGQIVTTYLYQIPPSNFKAVRIAKNGGKGSFYVTLDKPSLQGGDAEAKDLDSIDVENAYYDSSDYQDMNLRIHVGEAVRTYPWSQTSGFYKPRRFLGKVWYQQYLEIPCDEWEGMPSMSPTRIGIPPLLTDDGIPVETVFSLSFLFQRSLDEAEKMSVDVQSAFAPAVLYLQNVEWVFNHCIWGQQLKIISQDLSEPFRRRNLRGDNTQYRMLQADITVLKVVVSVKGYAHSDSSSCPAGATPTTPLEGKSWGNTLASIATNYTNKNSDTFVDYFRDTDAYFEDLISVSAAAIVAPPTADSNTEAGATTNTDESTFPLIPVIAAAVAAVAIVVFVICLCCFRRRRKRDNRYDSDSKETRIVSNIEEVENIKSKSVRGKFSGNSAVKITPDQNREDNSLKKGDILKQAWPTLQENPLNEAMLRRGLVRCSSSPDMATVLSEPLGLRRTGSIGCLRDVWVDLNRAHLSARSPFNPGYIEQLLTGNLYPVRDMSSFYNEAEKNFLSDDSGAFVPYGTHFDFSDPHEALYYDDESNTIMTSLRYETSGDGGELNANRDELITSSTNPLVIQQVEMLEAKWKQLQVLYDDEADSDDDGIDLDAFNVESRIGLLMGRIEKMEEERQRKLALLQQEEWEEEQKLKKKRQVSSAGINYNKNFGKDLKIKKKKKKKNKVIDDLYLDDLSSESESDEEEEEGEFDVKWMRLKVPLAAQDPDTMRDMVNKGKDMS
jgi:hypothetical protein